LQELSLIIGIMVALYGQKFFGVVEYWSNGVMERVMAETICVLTFSQHSTTPILQHSIFY